MEELFALEPYILAEFTVVPVPSWPRSFRPQHRIVPDTTTHEWELGPPALTWVAINFDA